MASRKEYMDSEALNDELIGDESRLPTRQRLITHEIICGIRHKAINARLGRIEAILIGVSGTLLLAMLWIIVELIGKIPAHA